MPYHPTSETAVHALSEVQELAAQKQYSWERGCDVSLPQSSSGIETSLTSGMVVFDGEEIDIDAETFSHPDGDPNLPRWDALCVSDRTGTVEVFTGVPSELATDPQGDPIRGEAAFTPAPSDSITSETVCFALIWIPSGALNNDDLSDTSAGGVADPVIDRRVYQTGRVNQTTRRKTITSSGWYTIASQSPLGTGPTISNRLASALFTVRDTQDGRTSETAFWASQMDAEEPTIEVVNSLTGSASRAIQGIRLITGTTESNNGAEVQVNVQLNGDSQIDFVEYTVQNNYHYAGWWPEDFGAGTVPNGYETTEVHWNNNRHVIATSTDQSDVSDFSVDRAGNVSCDDLDRDTLGVRGFLSSDQTVPDSSFESVEYDAVKFSNISGFDTSSNTFVAPTGGYYLCKGAMRWNNVPADTRLVVKLQESGTEANVFRFDGGNLLTTSVSDVLNLTDGASVSFAVQQFSGGNLTLTGGTSQSYFSIMKLG